MKRDGRTFSSWNAADQGLFYFSCAALLTFLGVILFGQPSESWNHWRLANGLALAHGYPLYDLPGQPLLGWPYFPVGAFVFAAVGFLAPKPSHAVWLGGSIGFVVFLTPFIFYFFKSKNQPKGKSFLALMVVGIAICLSLLDDGGREIILRSHIDSFGLGFAGMAAVLLSLSFQGNKDRPLRTEFFIALLAWASFWSKQNFALVPVALLTASLLTSGWKKTSRLFWVGLGVGALSFFLVGTLFPLRALWFNCVALGSHFPWKAKAAMEGFVYDPDSIRKTKNIFGSLLLIPRRIMLPLLFGALALAWANSNARRLPAKNWVSKRLLKDVAPFLALALFNIPLVILSYSKAGATENAYFPIVYFVIFFSCICLFTVGSQLTHGQRLANLTLFALLLAMPALVDKNSLLKVAKGDLREDIAYRYIARYPGKSFFPMEPSAQLGGDGKVYFTGLAALGYVTARLEIDANWVASQLPASVSLLALSSESASGVNSAIRKIYRSRFVLDKPITIPELPGFQVYLAKPAF